jgi:hypothetical protein
VRPCIQTSAPPPTKEKEKKQEKSRLQLSKSWIALMNKIMNYMEKCTPKSKKVKI